MSAKKTPRPPEDRLDHRYGEIGISALVATLRYLGDTKNPAYAPVDPQPDERATKDPMAAMESAGPARPWRAIW